VNEMQAKDKIKIMKKQGIPISSFFIKCIIIHNCEYFCISACIIACIFYISGQIIGVGIKNVAKQKIFVFSPLWPCGL